MSLAKPSRDRRTLLGVVTSTFLDQVEHEDFDKFIYGSPGFVQGLGAIPEPPRPTSGQSPYRTGRAVSAQDRNVTQRAK
jgi:hypothetical protein